MTSLHMYSHIGKHFDKNGSLITNEEHTKLMSDDEYYRIGADQRGGIFVLTTWLGVDLAKGVSPYPYIFETRMFTVGDPDDTFYVEFSNSSDNALVAHRKAVKIAADSKETRSR